MAGALTLRKIIFFWGRWILSNAIGFSLGMLAGTEFPRFIIRSSGVIHSSLVYLLVIPACLGLAVGVAQSIASAGWLPPVRKWAPATLEGAFLAALAFLLANVFSVQSFNLVEGLMLFAVLGAAIGLGQRNALRNHYRKAGWWIPANAIAFSGIAFSIHGSSNGYLIIPEIAGYILISGGMLVWLAHRTESSPAAAVERFRG